MTPRSALLRALIALSFGARAAVAQTAAPSPILKTMKDELAQCRSGS